MAAPAQIEHNPLNGKPFSKNYYSLRKAAQRLPVMQQMDELLTDIDKNQVVIVCGETGSGKTTQLPPAIMQRFKVKVACTQNRQLATKLTGERCAEELDVKVGREVGIKYKGVDLTSKASRLLFLTDGTLLMTAISDPLLSDYGAIVIDEAHQHSIATDQLIGLLKGIAGKRKDLKIIIMSATIDAGLFLNYFPGSKLVEVRGREHPVLVHYLEEKHANAASATVDAILRVHLSQRSGDILVFAPGAREIIGIVKRLTAALQGDSARFNRTEVGALTIFQLYAGMPLERQEEAVESVAPVERISGDRLIGRKVIIATNIAETAITVPGVNIVIDCLRMKAQIWNPEDESWSFRTLLASQAQAKQRAGRAGREGPGLAFRLCSQKFFREQLPEHPVAEIQQSDLLGPVLQILKLGQSPVQYPWIIPPAPETVVKALSMLESLGAVDARGSITPRGEAIFSLPVHVFSACILLESPKFGCSDQMLSLVAMLEATEGGAKLFVEPRNDLEKKEVAEARQRFAHPSSDHLTLFNIYLAWRQARVWKNEEQFVIDNKLKLGVLRSADQTRNQLLHRLFQRKDWKLSTPDPASEEYYSQMLMALAAGSFLNVAKRESLAKGFETTYQTVRFGKTAPLGKEVLVGVPSADNEWIIYNEFRNNGPTKRGFLLCSALPIEMIVKAQPVYWCTNVEFFPEGHIQDGIVKAIARMTGSSEDYIRGAMPSPTEPKSKKQ